MGIAERKEREKEQRRLHIIDAAEQVFFTKGFEIATMDEVARKAEYSKGTLYLYFKNKHDLMVAIHLRGLEILANMMEEASETGKSGLERLRNISETYIRFSKDYPNYFHSNLYMERIQSSDLVDISVGLEDCALAGERLHNLVTEAISAGQQDGSVAKHFNPHELALMLWASTRGMLQLYHLKKNQNMVEKLENVGVSFDQLIPNFLELLGAGIQGAPSTVTTKQAS